MSWLEFDGERAGKFIVLPAGKRACLRCEKRSRGSRVIKLTEKFRVRLCPKCYNEYERVVDMGVGDRKSGLFTHGK